MILINWIKSTRWQLITIKIYWIILIHTNIDLRKLLNTKTVQLFVRKIKSEDNITLPFTYFGTGKFINQRDSNTTEVEDGMEKQYPTLMFDIELDNPVPEEYWFDYEIPEEIIN